MAEAAIGEILVQADDLRHRVRELGARISHDYARRNPLLIGVLKGAVFFLSDLLREIDIPCEVDFMAVASYGSATSSSDRTVIRPRCSASTRRAGVRSSR